jgi:hypothetical protein
MIASYSRCCISVLFTAATQDTELSSGEGNESFVENAALSGNDTFAPSDFLSDPDVFGDPEVLSDPDLINGSVNMDTTTVNSVRILGGHF